MNYISAAQFAASLGLSKRRALQLLLQGRVHGAALVGSAWIIPEGAEVTPTPTTAIKRASWQARHEIPDFAEVWDLNKPPNPQT